MYGDSSLVNKDVLQLFDKLVCTPGDTEAWKSQVGYAETTPYNNPDVQVVACGQNGGQWGKYALDVAKVVGQQVTSATAVVSTTNNQWQVNLTMDSAGASAWSTLTTDLYDKYESGYAAGDEDDVVLDQTAITLDGNVVSAPDVQSPIPGGNTQVTGDFTQEQATQLQALSSGQTRTQVAAAVVDSLESATDAVQSFYRADLGRAGAASELAIYVKLLGKGATLQAVQAYILGSTEAYNNRS